MADEPGPDGAQGRSLPEPPAYGHRSVAEILPSCAAALGVPGFENALGLPEVPRVCVVMVDGLGRQLLTRNAAHTPFLRAALQAGQGGIPTTVTTVSRPQFERSPLTRAALRGGTFIGADTLHARTTAAARAMAASPRMLLYFYLTELDKAGHLSGCASPAWEEALEEVDACIRRLDGQLPTGTLVLVTGDHGMVDVPEARRIDYGAEAGLVEGVRHTAGEPRMVHLHVEDPTDDGAVQRVLERWRERFGSQAWVMTRAEAVARGLFGDLRAEVAERIGDVLVSVHGDLALYDGRRVRPAAFAMVGQHGSLTRAERQVPFIAFRAAGRVQSKRRRRG
ncbi:MAG: alkaline phosphatase family protein [Sinomonas sp.]|nr:alkaline phosphatase family protein [Sinomonas sp.]